MMMVKMKFCNEDRIYKKILSMWTFLNKFPEVTVLVKKKKIFFKNQILVNRTTNNRTNKKTKSFIYNLQKSGQRFSYFPFKNEPKTVLENFELL